MPEVQSRPCFLAPTQLNPRYPLFVFLPGMDGTGQLLRLQTEGLEACFDVRCLAIPPDDLTSWDDLTEQVISLIEAELKKRPQRSVYLCGESFGGCLALKIVLRSPQLIDRLILVNPASSFRRQAFLQWGSQITRWLPPPLYSLSLVGFLPFLASLGRMHKSDCHALLASMQSVPQKTSIWRLSLLKEFDINEAQFSQIQQPVLIVAGAADRLLPSVEEAQHLVKSFPNAKMVVLPQCGHACLLEAGVDLYGILKAQNFLPNLIAQTVA